MFCVIYLLTSPPLRTTSVLWRTISSCPIKTIKTLSLGYFTRPSAPSGLRVVVCAYLPKGRFLTTFTYFVYGFFYALVNPSASRGTGIEDDVGLHHEGLLHFPRDYAFRAFFRVKPDTVRGALLFVWNPYLLIDF